MAETVYFVDTDVVGGAGDGSSLANAYATLQAAENDRDADITGGNAVAFRCRGTAADSAVEILGWTTDADSYVRVYGDPDGDDGKHAGVWSTSKYRISSTGNAFVTYENFVRLEGIQIAVTGTTDGLKILEIANTDAGSDIRLSDLLLVGRPDQTTYSEMGLYANDSDANIACWNTIIYVGTKVASGAEAIRISTCATVSLYSVTAIGGYRAIRVGAGTVTAKNTYAGTAAAGEDWYFEGGTLAKTNCASSDTSADDAGGNESATNCVNSVAIDTDTFVNVTAGSENYHLATDGNSPLTTNAGVDTSGESAPLNFTTDIDGNTRSGTWNIGADQYVAAGGAFVPYPFSRGARGGRHINIGGSQ